MTIKRKREERAEKGATEAEFITKVLPVGFQPMLRQNVLQKGLETSG